MNLEAVRKLTMLKHFFNIIYASKEISALQWMNADYTFYCLQNSQVQVRVRLQCYLTALTMQEMSEKRRQRERTR